MSGGDIFTKSFFRQVAITQIWRKRPFSDLISMIWNDIKWLHENVNNIYDLRRSNKSLSFGQVMNMNRYIVQDKILYSNQGITRNLKGSFSSYLCNCDLTEKWHRENVINIRGGSTKDFLSAKSWIWIVKLFKIENLWTCVSCSFQMVKNRLFFCAKQWRCCVRLSSS